MTTRDWEEKMRVKQAMVALEIKAKAATFPVFHVKIRSRPILPEPDFSLEEIEQAQTIIKEL